MKRFTGHDEDWGDFIDVKICYKKINLSKIKNEPPRSRATRYQIFREKNLSLERKFSILRRYIYPLFGMLPFRNAAELRGIKPALSNKVVLFGSVTDAYNQFEFKYNNTRNILLQLMDSDAKIEILTKSSLVVRDIDILKKLRNVKVGISINTLDDHIRKEIEPFASNTAERINTLRKLTEAGINCYVFIAPIFPLITSFKEIIKICIDYTHEFYFENLNLKGSYFHRVFTYINKYHSNMASLYNDIYKLNNHEYWDVLEKEIMCYSNDNRLNYKLFFHH